MEAAVITTYRCNCRCVMCNVWKHPTEVAEEFDPKLLEKLPPLSFANVTGGEPFLRDDIEEIVSILRKKAKRVVISTNGYFTEKVTALARRHPGIGLRISLEGLPAANDELRGLKDGFDHGIRTLLELQRLGIKDIGFGITVSDRNARDMLELYQLAKSMGVEFATAAVHNSYYFHKFDNRIDDRETVIACFRELVGELLKTGRVKNWFRAYFNYGLINYVRGNERLLPCGAGGTMFFLDPRGEVLPCNGLDQGPPADSMGNLRQSSFEEIWNGEKAREIKERIAGCAKNCWMIGTASPAIKEAPVGPLLWVLRNKSRAIARSISLKTKIFSQKF